MYITKIRVSNGTDAAELNVESTRTLRSVFDEAGLSYDRGMLMYNGQILGNASLDSTVADVTANPDIIQKLTMTVKADNAVDEETKVTAVVNGSALIITSTATPDELKTLQKYRPEAMKLCKIENGHKEEIFKVSIGAGTGSICKFGAVYSNRANDAGKATITINVPDDVTDVKAWAEDTLGVSILNLAKTEKQFAAMLGDVAAEKQAVSDAITVM